MKSRYYRGACRLLSVLLFGAASMPMTALAEGVLLASDVHADTSDLGVILNDPVWNYDYESVILVGDHGGSGTSDTTEAEYNAVRAAIPSGVNQILTQGNHDASYYTHETGAVSLTNNDQYNVYVINWTTFNQGPTTVSTALAAYLNSQNDGKVIFVVSHAPLHSKREGILQDAANNVFNTLQNAGTTRDIVFVWGHNHSNDAYDANVNVVSRRGSMICNTDVQTCSTDPYLNANAVATLNFSSINAGYVSTADYYNGTLVDVSTADNAIYIKRLQGNSEIGTYYWRIIRIPRIWTAWMSRDRPTGGGDGEFLSLFLQEGRWTVCTNPLGVQCRRISDKVPWNQTGQVVTCELPYGGYCLNANNPNGCDNYEVRFLCPDLP